ncbi:unnamed protein product [Phytophthora fragariaefolia]|uniref:Unnamed protein product n=1 Tax=Phytophthora fragariaefolia TaxID=1490495 RepID=A0A9W7D862_9STRA|nr:unnamed protein product [Phytophthora fragariaefolia]
MVIHSYSVFAFGYSGNSSHFLPMAYLWTSQKRKLDVGWCIRYIKRVCFDACGSPFSPEFVMMDADNAQYNACAPEVPHATVLMCWFHVTKNVWKHAIVNRVSFEDTRIVFEDLYDMHYAPQTEFKVVKH